ncbi:hypothetical protein ABFS82_06G171700 [Erythranthe guttata]|uniref:AAA+ ATPase domain-containing protein n=1 Tax=Erythranthe guttata TaxID=4155 RepID=A0A022RLI0_ERYGU|nr:PREDICTED: disease resistance protein RPM1-like [Erythranthe guttata]EYU39800.1 hypothetical protein MIMGU_mgv1a026351mg [Erythranthe guttata]|eukprot:XP_012834897.1 PREDICTED: disease resistance protein RPM1-like [Erythranthe guttata]
MTDAAVQFFLKKTDNWLSRELNLPDNIRARIKSLKDELGIMRAVFKDIDNQREQHNQIREWIQQLRNVSYEIEDVLDIRAYQKYARENTPWYHIGSRIGNHSIADLIEGIEENLENIKSRKAAYDIRFPSHRASTSTSSDYEREGIAPLYTPEVEIVGVEEQRQELASWVLDIERAYKVMFVVGMGGSGKTALVKLVYDQLKTDFDCHIWLTASKSVNSQELLSIMLSKLRTETANSPQTLQDLVSMLNNYLRDKRYLIIIDDLWTIEVWDDVKYALPKDKCSRVIITTRRGDISSSCRESSVDVYKIQPLSFEKARELFERRCLFPSATGTRLWAEKILKRCEGLPLGVIEIGKALSNRYKSESELKKLHDSLQAELASSSGQLSSIRRALMLSYDDLPDHLKFCFLYMTMFPDDYSVKRRTLIRLWIAEGLVEKENGKEVEDIGEKYLEELMERNLIQASESDFDGRPQTCRLHSLMHKIALSKSADENFCTVWKDPKGDISKKTRRLSVQSTEFDMRIEMPCFPRTLFTSSFCLKTAPRIGSSLKLLKTLHLDGASVDTFPKGIEKLLLLKYLCLSNTRIKMVPVSIGRLQHLETLNLKQTFVTSVPDTLTNLTELRHLLICRYNYDRLQLLDEVNGFKVPTEISKLTHLQKLSFVRADSDDRVIQELRNLKELRKLAIIDLPRDSGPILCQVIQSLRNLHSLSMTSLKREETLKIQEINNPPQLLQRLYLKGHLEKMPRWISKLHDLVRLRLKQSRLRQDNNPITILGELPNLLELQLLDAYTGVQLDFEVGTFLKLKVLEFDQMKELTVIIIDEEALPCLEKLIISRCQRLRHIPVGIENVTQLKELHLGHMPPHFIEPLKRNGSMRQLVQHIQKIDSRNHHGALEDLS